jgi:hypothetical protein
MLGEAFPELNKAGTSSERANNFIVDTLEGLDPHKLLTLTLYAQTGQHDEPKWLYNKDLAW